MSPRLARAAASNRTEADVRALASAKIAAEKAYLALAYSPKDGLSDDELVDRELALIAARTAFFAADRALHEAL